MKATQSYFELEGDSWNTAFPKDGQELGIRNQDEDSGRIVVTQHVQLEENMLYTLNSISSSEIPIHDPLWNELQIFFLA